MCGIFGSKQFKLYEQAYKENKKRGKFAHGQLFVRRNGSMYVRKGEGELTLAGEYMWRHPEKYDIFLGHTQAPTSAHRDYSPLTTHPFECGNFVVAHNGVLENHMELAKEHGIDPDTIKVDSQIIPALLDSMYVGSDVMAITEVCNMLRGIFSCWIFIKSSKLVYIVRNGCTLYRDDNNNSFSSVKTDDINIEIPEGIIYCHTVEGLTQVGEFNSNNPFFIL